ncbi:hypothetical protein AB0D30_21745 [Streptomyces sp. NPDC048409]
MRPPLEQIGPHGPAHKVGPLLHVQARQGGNCAAQRISAHR